MIALEEIKNCLNASGGDCECHSMVTCPDKAQIYWEFYDEHVGWLMERLEKADSLLHEFREELCCYSTGMSVINEDSVLYILDEIYKFHESLTPKPKDK